MNRHAPGPLLVFATALAVIAFASDHPAILAAVAIAAVALHLAAPARRSMYLVVGATIGAGIAVINPLVQANGNLILVEFPDIPIVDLQVTLEEVVAGLAMGLRAFAVTVLIGAVLAHADPDRLLALAGRLAPRSALAASIAARLLPTLERDAASLTETLRLRGGSLRVGPVRTRIRTAGGLALPLMGSALDRSLDVAAAMAARGYGSGRATRMPSPGWSSIDRLVLVLSTGLAVVAALAVAGRVGDYDYYPTLAPLGDGWGPASGLIVVAVSIVAAGALRR